MTRTAHTRPASGGQPPRQPASPTRMGGSPGGAGERRRIGFGFFQDVGNELKKVVWPTRETTVRLSAVVVATSAAIGVLLGMFDWVFTQIMQRFLVPPITPPGL